MKKISLTFLVLFLAAFSSFAQAQNNDAKTNQTTYAALVEKLKSGDTNVDYKALRMAFTETKKYSYSGVEREERENMFKPFSDKNFQEALNQAEKILEKNYVAANAHFVAYTAAKELKDNKKADFHKAILLGLLSSIKGKGDGRSAQNAFLPITIDEEYTLMNFMGYRHNNQSLQTIDGHKFDVFEVANSTTGEKTKLYFNIDVIWKAESAIFAK